MSDAAALVRAPASACDLLVRCVHVVDPREGHDGVLDVLIRGGEVAELAEPGTLSAPDGVEVIEAAGHHLLPAFFDPHVHLRTPGDEHEEDIATGTRAAAAGGFAAIVAMPNTRPPVDSAPVLGSLRETAAREACVPVAFLAAITRGQAGVELTEMAELRDAGALGFTDDGLPVTSAGVLRRALRYQRLCGGVVALHEEDPSLSGEGVMHEGEVSALLGLAGIPSVSESTMIARDAALALYEGARVHVMHVSAAESVDALAAAKAAGAPVTAEACPHHLVLTDEELRAGPETRLKMNPPLRAAGDREALVEALRTGVIDCVATDHAPHAREEKEVPFEQAPMGTTGLETAFAALYTGLVIRGLVSLPALVERMTAGAAVFGLPVARVAAGQPANLALVDTRAEWEVGESGYESRSDNCCFDGRRLTGKVALTLAAGAVAHRDRALAATVVG